MDDRQLPFTEHLSELRQRLLYSLIPVGVAFIAVFLLFADRLFDFFMSPMLKNLPKDHQYLVYTGYMDVFFIHLKISGVASVFLCTPFIFYQIWLFVAPGLYDTEKRLVIPFVLSSTIFFTLGGSFGYFLVLPMTFKFLIRYSTTESIQAMITVNEYFTSTIQLLFVFAIAFELPVFLVFAAQIGLITEETLLKYRKYAIVIAFIIGAVLTPTPDVITQTLLAVPLLGLYELSIVGIRFLKKRQSSSLS